MSNYISTQPLSVDDLSKTEQAELAKFGIQIGSKNNDNYTSLYKFINKNRVGHIENFKINDIEIFKATRLENYFHGCNMMIPRLVDYDIAIYDRNQNIILPISQASYIPTTVIWKRFCENFQVFTKKDQTVLNPKINQGQKYWFDNGIDYCERIGEIRRTDYFDFQLRTYGTLHIWEIPRRAEDLLVYFCKERAADLTPIALTELNEITGHFYNDSGFSFHFQRLSGGFRMPEVISKRPKSVDYEDY